MKLPKAKGKTPNKTSTELATLFEGVSQGVLAQIFHYDSRKVAKMLAGLEPCGERNGYPIYDLAEAASRLAIPSEKQIIEAIRRMPVNKLPVSLQKEFWDAQRSRQVFEENAKDLWRTEQVFDAIVEIYRVVKTSAMLFVDAVARETELSEKQRALIEQLTDDLLATIHDKSLESPVFAKVRNVREQTESLRESAVLEEVVDDDDLGLD